MLQILQVYNKDFITVSVKLVNDQAEESVNLLALYPDLLLWPPPETCSPHQSYVWERFLEKRKKKKAVKGGLAYTM